MDLLPSLWPGFLGLPVKCQVSLVICCVSFAWFPTGNNRLPGGWLCTIAVAVTDSLYCAISPQISLHSCHQTLPSSSSFSSSSSSSHTFVFLSHLFSPLPAVWPMIQHILILFIRPSHRHSLLELSTDSDKHDPGLIYHKLISAIQTTHSRCLQPPPASGFLLAQCETIAHRKPSISHGEYLSSKHTLCTFLTL